VQDLNVCKILKVGRLIEASRRELKNKN